MHRFITMSLGVVALSLAALGCGAGAAQGGQSAPVGAPALVVAQGNAQVVARGEDGNPGGKYEGLLTVVRVPEDEETYGSFKDYGLWGPGQYAGALQPKGYWVYAAPNWYVWEHQRESAHDPDADASSANGRYVDLVTSLDVPADRDRYGEFYDYGAWGPGEYAGAMQPEGYWVYVAPTWYVWRRQR